MTDNIVREFKELLEVLQMLMGPEGCAWDRKQTLVSMRNALLEEACEVIEAIDEEDDQNLEEELGDLFYTTLFFCSLAEKENRFPIEKVFAKIREKLIMRHPHVFGEKKIENVSEIMDQWEEIKKKEKPHRESLMDGIPKGLPSLARAYKVAGKMKKASYDAEKKIDLPVASEEEMGRHLWEMTRAAYEKGWNPENALRKEIVLQEQAFRKWENI